MSMHQVSRVICLLCLLQGVIGISIQPSTWIQGESASVTCTGVSGTSIGKDGVTVAVCRLDLSNPCTVRPAFNNIYTASKTSTNISVNMPSVSKTRDNGVWTCQGLGVGGILLTPPVWIQGQPASITCNDSVIVYISRTILVTTCPIEPTVQCFISPDSIYNNYYTVSRSGDNVSVNIANVSKDRDGGYWSCSGSTADSQRNITINVKVLKAVPSVKIHLTSIGKIVVNQTTDIVCTAGVSYPHAAITWSINGGNNLGSGTTSNSSDGTTTSILQYTADKSDDNKILQCTATNGYGTPKTDSITLNIRYSPRLDTRVITISRVSGNISDIVQLVADVISYPPPTFTWYYNNINTGDVDDDVFKQIDTNISINTYRSTLYINITSNIYYTSYTVNVSNNIGYTQLQYQVIGQSKPDAPSNVNPSSTRHDSICITWTPGFNGGDQQEFIVQHSVDNKTWSSSTPLPESDYCIKNLQADTPYYIRVIAINKYGDSQPVYLILSGGSSTAQTLPRESDTPTGTNEGLIAGIVTTIVIAIIVVAVVVFILVRKRRQGKKNEELSTYDGLYLNTRTATGVDDASYQGLQHYVNLQSSTTENQNNDPLQHRQQTAVDGRDQTTAYDSLNTVDDRTPVYDSLNTADDRTQTPVYDSLNAVDDKPRDHVSVEYDATESYVNVSKENAAYANLGTQPSK